MDRIHSQKNLTWHEIMGDYVVADLGLLFEINFDDNLWACFRSIELLECLGFCLADNYRMIAMRKEKIQSSVNAVSKMLKGYNDILNRLTEPQVISNLIFVYF